MVLAKTQLFTGGFFGSKDTGGKQKRAIGYGSKHPKDITYQQPYNTNIS